MKKNFLTALVCSFFLLSCDHDLTQTLFLKPDAKKGKDAVIASIVPDNNYGNLEDLHNYAWTQDGDLNVVRGLIQFEELSKIPVNAEIKNAYLTLFYNPTSKYQLFGIGHQGENAIIVQRVTSAWKESKITWASQPSYDETNQVFVPNATSPTQSYKINVTALVKDIVKSKINHGFLIRLNSETPYKVSFLASSDHPNEAIHPQLNIDYVIPVKNFGARH